MPPILVGIDGTGVDAWGNDNESRNKGYDRDFENSFVRRICRAGENTLYLRGPGYAPTANGLLTAIHRGRDFIRGRRSAGVDGPILLTGYSRGASGVIVIASMLGQPQYRINVDAMLLFDCVDRDMPTNSQFISANVGHVLHVKRSDAARSRPSFSNSGTEPFPGSQTKYLPKEFFCTHGAMGGTPWPMKPGGLPDDLIFEGPGAYGVPDGLTAVNYLRDALGAEEVQAFIKPFMREHGFPIPPDVSYTSQLVIDDAGLRRMRERRNPTPGRTYEGPWPTP
jgi:hypothetical protein